MAALLVLGTGLVTVTPSVRGIGATVASALLIWGLVLHDRTPIAQLLARSVPAFLGRVSYGTYLWHWPVIVLLETVLIVQAPVVALAAVVLSTALAALSYEVLEMPIRRSRGLSRFTWQTAAVGLATSALVAVTVVPLALSDERRPVLAAGASGAVGAQTAQSLSQADASTEQVPSDVDWSQVGESPDPSYCPADDPARCILRKGSGPSLLVVGDSQAMMLTDMFTAMADEHDLTVSMSGLPGCMWQTGIYNTRATSSRQRRCEDSRVGWYEQVLPKLDPDVVVLIQRPRDDEGEWSGFIKRRGDEDQPLAQAVLESTRETVATISDLGARTLLAQEMVMPDTFNGPDCLATAKDAGDCAVALSTATAPSDGYFLAEAAQSSSVFTVNLNPAFCPGAPVCAPVVDGQVVWRDDHHLTSGYAARRRDEIWQLIQQTGVLSLPGDRWVAGASHGHWRLSRFSWNLRWRSPA